VLTRLSRGCKKEKLTTKKVDLMLGFEAGVAMQKKKKLKKRELSIS